MKFLEIMSHVADFAWIIIAIGFVFVVVFACVIEYRERKAKQQEEVEEEFISDPPSLADGPVIDVLCLDEETGKLYRRLEALKFIRGLVENPKTGEVFLIFKTSKIEDCQYVPRYVLCAESYVDVEKQIEAAKREWKDEKTV